MMSVVRPLLVLLLLTVAPSFAQVPWPQKQVRVIVSFPAGGSADTLCRIVADKLSSAWNQPVIVDNRAGAGGNAKANPRKVTYASQGNGSTSHLPAQMLATMAGIEMVHVPYKGEGPALIDIIAGRVDIFIGNISAALRFEQAKQVKFLGLASRSRSSVAPDVPDAAEIGLPGLIASAWFALAAPPGTPGAVVQKVNADTTAALKLPDVRAKFPEQGAEPQGQSIAATAAFIKEEEARWRAVIKSANVTLE